MTTCIHCGQTILGPDSADMYWHEDGFLRCATPFTYAEPESQGSGADRA